jgi:hypothetical protein
VAACGCGTMLPAIDHVSDMIEIGGQDDGHRGGDHSPRALGLVTEWEALHRWSRLC